MQTTITAAVETDVSNFETKRDTSECIQKQEENGHSRKTSEFIDKKENDESTNEQNWQSRNTESRSAGNESSKAKPPGAFLTYNKIDGRTAEDQKLEHFSHQQIKDRSPYQLFLKKALLVIGAGICFLAMAYNSVLSWHTTERRLSSSTKDSTKEENEIDDEYKLLSSIESWANLQLPGRIVAVGDLHGDFRNTKRVLKMAGIIDDNEDWAAGEDTVVQTGDIFDRGPRSIEIVELFRKLQVQAAKAGGRLINLLGNHELMNLKGKYWYVGENELRRWGRKRWRNMLSLDDGLGKWLRGLPTIVKIRDTLFIHAGLAPQFAELGIEEVNNRVTRGLMKYNYTDVLLGTEGPHWTRMFSNRGSGVKSRCEKLERTLETLNARRMVIGHNVQLLTGEPEVSCGEKLFIIDSGISNYYGGHIFALEISTLYPLRYPEVTKILSLD